MECYRWIKEYYVKASELAVEANVNWGKEEAGLVSDLVARLMDFDFIVSSYDPGDFVDEKIGVNKDRVNEYRKLIDGEDVGYNEETEKILSSIENKFKKHVQ